MFFHGVFLVSRNSRNSRKRRGCAGVPSELVSPTNFTNIYRYAMVLSPTDYTDYTDFPFFDSLFCFAKIALWICTDFIAARWFF